MRLTPLDSALQLFAFTMFTHVLGASLVLGFSWFAFAFELMGRRRGDGVYVDCSKAVSKAIVLIYATIGSLGTAVTVELFALWPAFVKILGTLLWWPFVLVAAMILSNFFLIAVYWYTYDRISSGLHVAVGFLMALTSSLIPFNFRTIIAFTNQPVGMIGNQVETMLLYANPSLPPLYAHTVFASLSVAGFVMAAGAALAVYAKRGNRKINERLLSQGLVAGVLFLVPQALVGAWYLFTLGLNAPRIFTAVTGLLVEGSSMADGQPWLRYFFAAKLVLVGCLVLGSVAWMSRWTDQSGSKLEMALVTGMGILAPLVILMGETTQEYSHLPYLIMDRFTADQFLNPAFPLSAWTLYLSIAVFGVFILVLFSIIYVVYVKK